MIWHLSVAEHKSLPHDRITQALEFLANTDFSLHEPDTKVVIDGDNLFAQIQAYETAPAEDMPFETHEVYADLQYVVSGKEAFGTARRDGLKETIPYDPERDITFYARPAEYETFILNPGECILVTPNVGHMPRCQAGERSSVKKVVVKIKMV